MDIQVSRRDFLRAAATASSGMMLGGCGSGLFSCCNNKLNLPIPSGAQMAWQEAELGLVYHWDLHVFDGKKYSQGQNRRAPIENIDMFNPAKYDTDQWIAAAVAMGAKFAILTASHETGFRLWQSDANPYCMKALKWRNGKGDIVKDFVESCKKYNIQPGIYMGTRWNSHLGVLDHKVQPHCKLTQAEYNALIEKEVEEICSRYGELFEIWLDGGVLAPHLGGPDVLPIFEKYQPDGLFYHNAQRSDARWGGTESGTVGYPCWATMPFKGSRGHIDRKLLMHGDAEGKYWSPAMSDAPLRGYNGRHEWFWEPGDEEHIFPLENLLDMYYKSVGRNSTLIIGVTPDDRGLLPEMDVKRMAEFGKEIKRRFSKPVAWTGGKGEIVELKLKEPAQIDHVVIMEDIKHGERIREYIVEATRGEDMWGKICDGTSIGHKRIQHFPPVEVVAVRLCITKSTETPIIRNLAVYNTA
jgi:alpha-L-fucosidase